MTKAESKFKEVCDQNMAEFNYKDFKKTHPTLLRCILISMEENNNNEKSNPINPDKEFNLTVFDINNDRTVKSDGKGYSTTEVLGIISELSFELNSKRKSEC